MKYLRQCYVIGSVGGLFFLNGCLLGWNAPSIPKLVDFNQTTLDHALSPREVSIVSTLCLIVTPTLLSSGVLTNKMGSRRILLAAAVLHFISWVVVALARGFLTLCFGKLIGAMGFGLGYHTTIVYLTEISSIQIRGYSLSSCCFFINVGMLAMFSIGPFVTPNQLAVVPAVVAIMIFVALLFVPESPVYFLNKGDEPGMIKSMTFLNRPMSDLKSNEKSSLMKNDQSESRFSTLKELLFVKKNLKTLFIVCGLNFGQQACGSLPVLFYATSLFEEAGSSVSPYVATIVVGVIQLLSIFISSSMVESWGRKPLYLISCAFTAFTNFTLGLCFYLDVIDSPLKSHVLWLPLTSTVIFIIAYSIGFGALTSVLVCELLDTKVRSIGSSIAFTTENLTAIIFLFTFHDLSLFLGTYGAFWIYCCICILMFIFVLILVPETKGKSADEIQQLL